MISIAEARRRLETVLFRKGTERVELAAAHGRVLAQDLRADLDMPPFDKACMDGYAARAAELSTGDATLALGETITAGAVPTREVRPGEAARIMTGSPMPAGADCVVMVERARPADVPGRVRLTDTPASGQHVQRRGELFRAGDVVLPAGTLARGPELAVMATIGAVRPLVFERPRVALVATGDELVDAGSLPGPGQIRDSNRYALEALVTEHGGAWLGATRARDDQGALAAAFEAALARADVLLVSGGVSAGDLDLVEPVLVSLGFEILFDSVALKPGQPAVLARRGNQLAFGLPGNPVSGLVVLSLFGVPALRYLAGRRADALDLPRLAARIAHPVRAKALNRAQYLPARVTIEAGELVVVETPWQGSSDMRGVTRANAYLVIETDAAPPTVGTRGLVLLWRDPFEGTV